MNATISLHRSLEALSPFRRSPEKRTAIPAKLQGELPAWLRGEVVRTCPAVFETNEWRAEHWFDGLGMIYAFRIGEAQVDFRSRLLDSEVARDAWRGRSNLGTFGTATTRPLLRRVFEPIQRISDNTNVNIQKLGKDLVAMTEGDRHHVIDAETLTSLGTVGYEGDGFGGAVMSAHPHFDFERGRVVNVATQFGTSGVVSIYEHALHVRKRQLVGSWSTKHVPYVHTFGLTPKNALIVAHPFTVSPLRMLWSSKGYIDHFEWQAREATRVVVLDRTTGAAREHVTDPFFVFHTVNAFERDDATVLDLLVYPDADIVSALRVERMSQSLPELRPKLVRLTLRPGVERASLEHLTDVGFEFPATNYRRVNGRPYRFAWGAADGPEPDGTYSSALVKVELETGASRSFNDGVHVFGEPLFVAHPQAESEDDGVLLSVGSSKQDETALLAVVDAKTMALVASAAVPSSIPLGFHGSFQRQEGAALA